jgi:sulfur-carrier protein
LNFEKKNGKGRDQRITSQGHLTLKIEVKLFANFREYLPPGSREYACTLELEEGTTIGHVLRKLQIPDSIPMIALVNGLHRAAEDTLREGDVLSIFPPVAGG